MQKEIDALLIEAGITPPVSSRQHWRPRILRWSDLYSYGEGNILVLDDLITIGGPNGAGKSSIVYIFAALLFNHYPTGITNIVRRGQTFGQAELVLEIGAHVYRINRAWHSNRSRQTVADLYLDDELFLSGVRKVYHFLESAIGTYAEFYSTTLFNLLLTPSPVKTITSCLLGLDFGEELQRVNRQIQGIQNTITRPTRALAEVESEQNKLQTEFRKLTANFEIYQKMPIDLASLRVRREQLRASIAELGPPPDASERARLLSRRDFLKDIQKTKTGTPARFLPDLTRAELAELAREVGATPEPLYVLLVRLGTTVVADDSCAACKMNRARGLVAPPDVEARRRAFEARADLQLLRREEVDAELTLLEKKLSREKLVEEEAHVKAELDAFRIKYDLLDFDKVSAEAVETMARLTAIEKEIVEIKTYEEKSGYLATLEARRARLAALPGELEKIVARHLAEAMTDLLGISVEFSADFQSIIGKTPYIQLSTGQRMPCELAYRRALRRLFPYLPPFLIFDEWFGGADSTNTLFLLKKIKEIDLTIVLTTYDKSLYLGKIYEPAATEPRAIR